MTGPLTLTESRKETAMELASDFFAKGIFFDK